MKKEWTLCEPDFFVFWNPSWVLTNEWILNNLNEHVCSRCAGVLALWVWRLITGFSTFQYHQPDSLDLVSDKNKKYILILTTEADGYSGQELPRWFNEFLWGKEFYILLTRSDGLTVWRSNPPLIIGREARWCSMKTTFSRTNFSPGLGDQWSYWLGWFSCVLSQKSRLILLAYHSSPD